MTEFIPPEHLFIFNGLHGGMSMKICPGCYLLQFGFFHGLFFYPEDGGYMYL
jgi:hypothetical protein